MILSPVVISIKTTSFNVSKVAFNFNENPPYSSSWRIGSSLSTENENPSVLEQRISSKI